MNRSGKIKLALAIAAIVCFMLAGLAYLQAAASYTLSFSFCTEPGTANAATARCRAPLLYGYAFWALLAAGVVLAVAAIMGRRQRNAA